MSDLYLERLKPVSDEDPTYDLRLWKLKALQEHQDEAYRPCQGFVCGVAISSMLWILAFIVFQLVWG